MTKPILCLDFDGVIHDYKLGWQEGKIYGNITPGFFQWASRAKDHFALYIYSSRSKDPQGVYNMKMWLRSQFFDYVRTAKDHPVVSTFEGLGFEFTHEKPPAFLTIDDRAIRFEGDWSDPNLDPAELTHFKPWMIDAS